MTEPAAAAQVLVAAGGFSSRVRDLPDSPG